MLSQTILSWTFSIHLICTLFVFSGETGLGKSTLMDTLFNTQFESTQTSHNLPGVKVTGSTFGKFHSVPQNLYIATRFQQGLGVISTAL